MAIAPSCGAVRDDSSPWNVAMGVRPIPVMTIESADIEVPFMAAPWRRIDRMLLSCATGRRVNPEATP
jgi:hypothetical protein